MSFDPFKTKMQSAGLSAAAVGAFERAYGLLVSGQSSLISEEAIEPVSDLPSYDSISRGCDASALLAQTVVIKLNGGLGTGMGLQKAKSLLDVRGGDTFLDLIAKQVLHLREKHGDGLRFLLMDSFSTSEDTAAFLAENYPQMGEVDDWELMQNRVPKIDRETMAPASCESEPDNEWCPPGHGDLYPALAGTGWLDRLLEAGVKYAFVSNSDNLGATLDLDLLNYFAKSEAPFLMEVTRRTAADRKGGHLARAKGGGGLLLRESAQCPDEDSDSFQDVDRHQYFNTNNLWIRLDLLKRKLDKCGGVLPLPVIQNSKTIDPRDSQSTPVIQLETAMGSAIECFDGAAAIDVPRSRFAPVKTTDDLLALRSDAYVVTDDFRLQLHPDRNAVPPTVVLDKSHFKMVDQLEVALVNGVPSLLRCESLAVKGAHVFSGDEVFEGKVEIG
ncbi:MAG: UDP-N-acetylglucosamine pyrophosphorylase [Verrucomicrobiales bacterium]|jgi:UDP-N-acetylglucosamine pyrophosphorylase